MWTNAGLNHLSQFHSVLTWAKVWLRVAGETQEEWIAGECLCGEVLHFLGKEPSDFLVHLLCWLIVSPGRRQSFFHSSLKPSVFSGKNMCGRLSPGLKIINISKQQWWPVKKNLFLMIYTEAVKYVSLWKPSPLPSDVLCIPGVPGVVNGNTCEMLPQFIQETFASAEVWQLPVEVASHITAGERGGPGENRVEKQWAEQRQCIYSRVRSRLGVS